MPCGCVLYKPLLYPCVFCMDKGDVCINISAWASALLVQTVMGNARALSSGTSNRYRLPRFFRICTQSNFLWIPAGELGGKLKCGNHENEVFFFLDVFDVGRVRFRTEGRDAVSRYSCGRDENGNGTKVESQRV